MVFKINSKDFLKALKDARANMKIKRNDPVVDFQSYRLGVAMRVLMLAMPMLLNE